MTQKEINDVANLLEQADVNKGNTISFKGHGLKLDKGEDADEIIDALERSSDLEIFELVGNTVGVEAAQRIAQALRNKPGLRRCLWADMFTGRLRAEIPTSLQALGGAIISAGANLVELDLSDNAFGPDCAKACVQLLESPSSYSMEVLKFNNNGLGGGGVVIADALINCHNESSKRGKPLALKVFVAGRNRLENPGAKALARAFKQIGTLTEIHLPQNGIQHEGVEALSEAVKRNPRLRHLNLNDNTFTARGAIAMGEAMEHIDSLEVVNFGDCLVRTEGAKAIARGLENSNPGLKSLILSFGEIEIGGGVAVCEAVAGKKNLETLDLNGNKFGDDGVEEILGNAEKFGFSDKLGSLSDDEGTDDESDQSESEEESVDQSHVSVETNGRPTVELTAENFLQTVTSENIVELSESERADLLDAVAELVSDAEATVGACAKLAGLLDENCLLDLNTCKDPQSEKVRCAVFQCADVLCADALDKYPNTPMLVINPLLVRIGLIKSEDKKFTPEKDPRGLIAITAHISQQNYFPKFIKKCVRSLVLKENKLWLKCPNLKSQLIQLLYL